MNDNTEQMIADAKDVVLGFAAAWTEWELAMAKDEDNSMEDPAMKQARASIRAYYCTPKKRVYVDDCLSYSEPPTYSHVIEDNIINTELISNTRAHIDANGDANPMSISHRFVVHEAFRPRKKFRLSSDEERAKREIADFLNCETT